MRLDNLFKNQNIYIIFPKFLGSYIYRGFCLVQIFSSMLSTALIAAKLWDQPTMPSTIRVSGRNSSIFFFKSINVISNPFMSNVMFFLFCSCSHTIVMFLLLTPFSSILLCFYSLYKFYCFEYLYLLCTLVFSHCNSSYPFIHYTSIAC